MEEISIKVIASVIGASISWIVLQLFALPFPAFVAGFIGAFIGELMYARSTFRKALITVALTSIAAAYVGSLFITKFDTYPPTGILAVIGFILAYQKDFILNQINSLISTVFKTLNEKISGRKEE